MKYVITGSLGNISLPVTQNLIKAGNQVTVISSNTNKQQAIEDLGATAAIGSVKDVGFLSDTFKGADAVYLMVPNDFSIADYAKFQRVVADNYVAAIQTAGVKNIVLLSSIGAHLRKGAGPIDALGYLEEMLTAVEGLKVKILRPSYFFNNLYSMVGLIKHAGIIGNNFGNTEEKLVLVDTDHIAEVATAQLLAPFTEDATITYISNDERQPTEIATILGAAIGKPDLQWVTFSDEDAYQGLLQAGINESFAGLYRDMGHVLANGTMQEDYWKHAPASKGLLKLEDFAKRFAGAYAAE
ncbi:NAD-dependent dehydratase [Mucilaginibacter conchicola]|uniref:NAD-dependent dehydratase n=1 Tax=Mucilaginibacter conchicola TaxID=2303333 RepID=A0A372NZY4_9SPHI|nr:NAD(P)H-binding protein [Mucilaginibacter conchicola]RFZ95471.1 NAD-dependent dehydratase [Mucilaginibacter conchicola]